MSREDLTPDPGLDPRLVQHSQRRQWDAIYELPEKVAYFIKAAKAVVPTGWLVLPWTLNRCVTIKNSRDEVQHTVTYEAIEDDYIFKMEDLKA